MPKAGWIFLLRKSNLPLAYWPFTPAKIGHHDAKSPKKELANQFFYIFNQRKLEKREG